MIVITTTTATKNRTGPNFMSAEQTISVQLVVLEYLNFQFLLNDGSYDTPISQLLLFIKIGPRCYYFVHNTNFGLPVDTMSHRENSVRVHKNARAHSPLAAPVDKANHRGPVLWSDLRPAQHASTQHWVGMASFRGVFFSW